MNIEKEPKQESVDTNNVTTNLKQCNNCKHETQGYCELDTPFKADISGFCDEWDKKVESVDNPLPVDQGSIREILYQLLRDTEKLITSDKKIEQLLEQAEQQILKIITDRIRSRIEKHLSISVICVDNKKISALKSENVIKWNDFENVLNKIEKGE